MRLTTDIIEDALNLLGPNGEHWTRGQYARDANGVSVNFTLDNACSFCLLGSLRRTMFNKGIDVSTQASIDFTPITQAIYNQTMSRSISCFNDSSESFDDVKQVMLEAIEIVKAFEAKLNEDGFDGS